MSAESKKTLLNRLGRGAFILNLIRIIFIAAIVAGTLNVLCFQLVRIEQSSMNPTLKDGDEVFLFKAAYFFTQPKSGDVIIFKSRTDSKINYVKRVIGLPGDTIEIAGGKVLRNGVELNEPYLPDITQGSYSITVPSGQYFVMGDNRNFSMDSRNALIGCITKDQILGKVLFSLQPYKKLEKYSHSYANGTA